MNIEKVRDNLYAEQHALLFTMIVDNFLDLIGEEENDTIKIAVKKYGNQRGGRMGQRADIDGRERNLKNYIIYGEWAAKEGDMDLAFPILEPEANMVAKKCPWYSIWNENNLLGPGAYYCRYVDPALAEGFNPELVLDTVENRTEGGDICDFRFRGNKLTEEDFKEINIIKGKLGAKARKDWDYHIAHLYYTMKEVIVERHDELGEKVIEKSLEQYEEQFGREAIEILKEFEEVDFNKVEDYEGMEA